MPVFKDFAENGDLLQSRDEPLNAENFSRYVQENGVEKAQGYLEALNDITAQMEQYFTRPFGDGYLPNSPSIIKKETLKLYDEKKALLQSMNFNSPNLKIDKVKNQQPG